MSTIEITLKNRAEDLCVTERCASYVCPACHEEVLCDIFYSCPVNMGLYKIGRIWHAESIEPDEECKCENSLTPFDPVENAPMSESVKEEVRKFIEGQPDIKTLQYVE